MTPDLRGQRGQHRIVAYPVRNRMRHPGTALRSVIVGTRRADLVRELFLPVNAFRTIGDSEAVGDPGCRMPGLHLPGEFVCANIQAAPTLGVADKPCNRHRPLRHRRQRVADGDLFEITRFGAANAFVLIQGVVTREFLGRVDALFAVLQRGVLRAALAGDIAVRTKTPGIRTRELVAGFVEEVDVIDLLDRTPGELCIVFDQVFQVSLGRQYGIAPDRFLPREIATGKHRVYSGQATNVAADNTAAGENERRRRDDPPVARFLRVVGVAPQRVVVADPVRVVPNIVARRLVAPRLERVPDPHPDPFAQVVESRWRNAGEFAL